MNTARPMHNSWPRFSHLLRKKGKGKGKEIVKRKDYAISSLKKSRKTYLRYELPNPEKRPPVMA